MKLLGFVYISVVVGSRIPRDASEPKPCHQKRLEDLELLSGPYPLMDFSAVSCQDEDHLYVTTNCGPWFCWCLDAVTGLSRENAYCGIISTEKELLPPPEPEMPDELAPPLKLEMLDDKPPPPPVQQIVSFSPPPICSTTDTDIPDTDISDTDMISDVILSVIMLVPDIDN